MLASPRSLFAALEGAIAHGKFDEMKSFYGPESQAYFNADPAVTSMPESGSAVGPEAIAEAARSEFGGKTVHFNIATLFHQTASTGECSMRGLRSRVSQPCSTLSGQPT